MMDKLEESLSETTVHKKDLLYPFAMILLMLSIFDLSGSFVLLTILSTQISTIFTELFQISHISEESLNAILNLIINLAAQTGVIIIFIFLYKTKRVEPEEKKVPTGNHWLTTYLSYTFLIVVSFFAVLLDLLLEQLGFTTVSPYSDVDPSLELLGIPFYYIIFFTVFIIGAAVSEELIFRRTFIPLLERRGIGTSWVLLFSGLLFSLMHTPADILSGSLRFAIVHFVNTFAGGLALGFLYMRTRNILWPIILHGLVNGVAVVAMIGLVRMEELNDLTIVGMSGFWVFIALVVGVGTVLIMLFQFIKFRNSPDPPVWFYIIRDFNIRSTHIVPVMLYALGFIGITAGLPFVFDFFFGLLGEASDEIRIVRYIFEIGYLVILVFLLSFYIFKKATPLENPDWVSNPIIPERDESTSSLGYTPSYSPDYKPTENGIQSYCGSCGQKNVQGTKYCVFCGTEMSNLCKVCGGKILPNTEFCVYCGNRFK